MMLSDFCLSEVCLSVAYIGPKSRTERPRETKIGTEVAHIPRDSGTTFKVKRSKVKVTRGGAYCGGRRSPASSLYYIVIVDKRELLRMASHLVLILSGIGKEFVQRRVNIQLVSVHLQQDHTRQYTTAHSLGLVFRFPMVDTNAVVTNLRFEFE